MFVIAFTLSNTVVGWIAKRVIARFIQPNDSAQCIHLLQHHHLRPADVRHPDVRGRPGGTDHRIPAGRSVGGRHGTDGELAQGMAEELLHRILDRDAGCAARGEVRHGQDP